MEVFNMENNRINSVEKPGYNAYNQWLGRLKASTAKTASSNFLRYMAWVEKEGGKFSAYTPDQMVEYQKAANNEQRYELLDLAQRYIGGLEGRGGYIRNQYNCIRSFFTHSRAELPRDPLFKARGTVEKVVGHLDAAEIRDIVLSCNAMYQAVFMSMFSAALDREMFLYWNLNGLAQLREDLKKDPEVIRVSLPGRKAMRNEAPYYSFVCSDAVELLKKWLIQREKLVKLFSKRYEGYEDPGAIFLGQKGEPVGKIAIHSVWIHHCRRLGLLSSKTNGGAPRFGKNLHELRDSYRSLFQKSGADIIVAEFSMGHTVDKLGYNKATQDEDWVREEYLKAMPWLNVLSSPKPHGFEERDEVRRLQRDLEEAKRKLDHVGDMEATVQTLKTQLAEEKRHNEFNDSRFDKLDAKVEKLLTGQS
jgi:hypothetical protein